jgi:Ca2+-binding EF-hand superfamily protein
MCKECKNMNSNANLDDLLTCQICFELYDTTIRIPKQLPCQHVYCLVCLNSLLNNQQIQCPNDRQFFAIDSLNSVPNSRIILNLLDVYKPSLSSSSTSASTLTQVPLTQSQSQLNSFHTSSAPAYEPKISKPSISPLLSSKSTYLTSSSSSPLPIPPPVPLRPVKQWDPDAYLREIFNDVDKDLSGSISLDELHEALKHGQSNLQFDIKTTRLIFNKYDVNSDGSINFSEFKEIFNYINEEQLKFLSIDTDGNEILDAHEFRQALLNHSLFNGISDNFINQLVNKIQTHVKYGFRFDIYCRVIARLDYLCHMYHKSSYFKQFNSIEHYLLTTFFYDFF